MHEHVFAQERVANRLLQSLPGPAFEKLRPHLRRRRLQPGESICHAGWAVEHVHFIERGFISLVKTMRDGRSVEVAGVGIDGVATPWSLRGPGTAAFDALVQLRGECLMISRDSLMRIAEADPMVMDALDASARLMLAQLGQTAACNRLHTLEERCGRWLLVADDNARSPSFTMTHELLATILGSQRAGLSIVANRLRREGAIDYRRAQVTILDRGLLEARACECYATAREERAAILAELAARARASR